MYNIESQEEFEALLERTKDKKVLCIVYGAPWCENCHKFKPKLKELIEQLSDRVEFVEVNADSEFGEQISELYKVENLPSVSLLSPSQKKHDLLVHPSIGILRERILAM